MLKLYIDNQLVELTENTSILLSRTRTDYLNPTLVKNSFSKTITIPNTEYNNKVFNSIWKLDRYQTNEFFNPSKRTPFTLYNSSNDIIESGYVKLNKINRKSGFCNYEITLYGELGNILYGLAYKEDPDTQELTELTLGDLIYEQPLNFTIYRSMIIDGWNALKNNTQNIYQTLNFAPAYNGKPKANKFDAAKVWVAERDPDESGTMWNSGRTFWDGSSQYGMPKSKTVDGIEYKLLNTMLSKMDPSENYGLLELPDAITDIEARDFRSYLLRPIIRLSKVFEAMDRYIYQKEGWHINLSDSFFSLDDYKNAWITLNMLYEINPDVETGTRFTQKQLFSKTAAPFKYLVSFCKMYGLYLDVDTTTKTLSLRSMKKFFDNKTEDLIIDEGSGVSVDPLSFNKSSYTFDFGESKDADFIKKYNESHDVPYGSKKVNTGYQFDNASDKFIKDNIFKNATDAIEQSPYYKFSNNYPAALYDDYSAYLGAKEIKYTLFANGQADDVNSLRYSATITRNNSGLYYIAHRYTWGGLQSGVYQDDYPKVQLHNDNNENIDGSNVIIYFRGMTTTYVAQPVYIGPSNKLIWQTNTTVNNDVYYNISDDSWLLKQALGKNCWINNIEPGFGFGSTGPVSTVKEIPNFTREDYVYSENCTLLQDRNFQTFSIQRVNNCTTSVGPQLNAHHITANNANGITGGYPVYFYHPISLQKDHKYLIFASVKVDQSYIGDLYTKYAGADDVPGELIDHMDISNSNAYVTTGSIMRSGTTGSHNLFPCKMPGPDVRRYDISVRWFVVYDLTMLGLEDRINTVEEGMAVIGVPTEEKSFMGTPYRMTTSHDFGTPTEIYVPSTFAMLGRDIYDRYWKQYISDLYSINTRVIEGTAYINNIHNSFKKFYWFDDALWCLSSVTDWDSETKKCKAKLIKVNDKNNYLN